MAADDVAITELVSLLSLTADLESSRGPGSIALPGWRNPVFREEAVSVRAFLESGLSKAMVAETHYLSLELVVILASAALPAEWVTLAAAVRERVTAKDRIDLCMACGRRIRQLRTERRKLTP